MLKRLFFLFALLSCFCLSKVATGQCSISTTPTCLLTNQTITFSSTVTTVTHWRVYDEFWNVIGAPNPINSFSFSTAGTYYVEALLWGGGNIYIPACEQQIIVSEYPRAFICDYHSF